MIIGGELVGSLRCQHHYCFVVEVDLYNIFSRRYPGDESPAYEFTSSLFELQIATD
jgi:hypothetical protein